MTPIQRVGILTAGGDAPGLNAVIRAVVLAATRQHGWEVIGIREGFNGLLARLPLITLDHRRVEHLLAQGGTILGAANRGNPFSRPIQHPDGTTDYLDVSHEALARLQEERLDALIVAGGDGTMSIAHKLVQMGAPIVGVPKTIDNDLDGTDVTFGFDTALNTATDALAKLQTTAEAHHRVMVLEVMGRNAGWIALHTGIGGGADAILIPEIPYDIGVVCEKIRALRAEGRRYSLIVVAEGAAPIDGTQQYYQMSGDSAQSRLGGIGFAVGNAISTQVEAEVRVTVLGHIQRGGSPTPRDRWLASCFGVAAVRLVADCKWGQMVALRGDSITEVPMADAIRMKVVTPDHALVSIARDLGIVFG
ncbi:MAG: ATP-dependent 6-phosphofructokinase [Armatimonadetes bacterium]|nr:ATP-dependent 6-phosphofructokinase [Anaerolineae bacterium]